MHQKLTTGSTADPFIQFGILKQFCSNVNFANNIDIGIRHMNRLEENIVQSSADIAVLAPSDDDVIEHDIIVEVEDLLVNAGIKITNNGMDVKSFNIVMVTAHNDENLKNFLDLNASNFRGKVVIVNTCAEGTIVMNNYSKWIQENDITSMKIYFTTLNATAVAAVIKELTELIGNLQTDITFGKLWKQSIDAAINNPDNELIKDEIEKLKDSSDIISETDNSKLKEEINDILKIRKLVSTGKIG